MALIHQERLVSRSLFRMSWWLNVVAMAALAAMMLLIASDVILRYVFNSPITGSMEIVQLLLAIMAAMGFAYVGILKEHVTIDTIVARIPPRAQDILGSITSIVSVVLLGLVTWRVVFLAESMRHSGITTAVLHVKVYYVAYVVALGMGALFLVFLRDASTHLVKVVSGSRPLPAAIFLFIIVVALGVFAMPTLPKSWLGQVDPFTAGIAGIFILIVLLFSRMTVGTVLIVVGFLGMVYLIGLKAGFTNLATTTYGTLTYYPLSVIPLFVLMGVFCFHSGINTSLFRAAYKWLGRLPGGLAMATVGASAGFAALTGSIVAATATMGSVSLPEMKRYKYDPGLATGCVAAAGGLGIMIPPSAVLAVYGIIAEESIGKLFLAGFLPGVLQATLFIATIYVICRRNPKMGPRGESSTFTEKMASLKGIWAVLALFLLVIGGLYVGVFTPMEAGGVGAFGAFLFALGTRRLTWKNFVDSLVSTTKLTAMIFFMIIGAHVFGYFLAVTRLPFQLADRIAALELNRYIILAVILGAYLFIGCIVDTMVAVIITTPILVPVVAALGFTPVWFGVMVVLMVSIGAITPPFAINVFVIYGIAKDIPLYTIYRGMVPFLIANLVLVALLVAFPQIALLIPDMMK